MQVIAHRGAAALRVENTLAAFDHAIELGADGAELDVRLSRDRQVVVHHDDALDGGFCRGPDGVWIGEINPPRIADLTFAELQRFDIGTPRPGSAYARGHPRIKPVPDQHIPRLADVIALVKTRSPTFRLIVEIKTPIEDAAREPWHALVEKTLAILREHDFIARTTLCSFDWSALVAAKQQCPTLSTWFTTNPLSWFEAGPPPREDDPPPAADLQMLRDQYQSGTAPWLAGQDPRKGYPEAIAATGGDAWFVYDRDCTTERVRAAASCGVSVATWGPNVRDRESLSRLAQSGVAAMCLDDPAMAVEQDQWDQ